MSDQLISLAIYYSLVLRSSRGGESLNLEVRTSDRPFHRRDAEVRRGGAERREQSEGFSLRCLSVLCVSAVKNLAVTG